MAILTLEGILENPWSVLTQDLPEHPDKLLLFVGQISATCLRAIAGERLDYLQDRRDWSIPDDDEHAIAMDEWFLAHNKIGEIIYQLDDLYAVPGYDFWLGRPQPKKKTVLKICKEFWWRWFG